MRHNDYRNKPMKGHAMIKEMVRTPETLETSIDGVKGFEFFKSIRLFSLSGQALVSASYVQDQANQYVFNYVEFLNNDVMVDYCLFLESISEMLEITPDEECKHVNHKYIGDFYDALNNLIEDQIIHNIEQGNS